MAELKVRCVECTVLTRYINVIFEHRLLLSIRVHSSILRACFAPGDTLLWRSVLSSTYCTTCKTSTTCRGDVSPLAAVLVDELLQKHRLQATHASFGSLTLLKEPQLIAARGLRER